MLHSGLIANLQHHQQNDIWHRNVVGMTMLFNTGSQLNDILEAIGC